MLIVAIAIGAIAYVAVATWFAWRVGRFLKRTERQAQRALDARPRPSGHDVRVIPIPDGASVVAVAQPSYGAQPPYGAQLPYGAQPTDGVQPPGQTHPAYPVTPSHEAPSTYPAQLMDGDGLGAAPEDSGAAHRRYRL